MDAPHDGKSYFPPTQLLHKGNTFVKLIKRLTDAANTRTQAEKHGKIAENALMKHAFLGFIMNQMSAKKGKKKQGKAAEAALMKEFAQLEELNAYESINPATLTRKQKMEEL